LRETKVRRQQIEGENAGYHAPDVPCLRHWHSTEQLISIVRDDVRKQQDALKIAQAKYQGGGTSELDVFEATTVLEATQSAIRKLEIQLAQGRNALNRWAHLLARSRGIPTPPRTITVGIPADLLRRRPDIRAAELAALAQSQIGVAEAQLLPAISISGTFGGSASTANTHNLGQVLTSTGVAYAGGPSFQWNILNYGQITQQCPSAGRHAAAAAGSTTRTPCSARSSRWTTEFRLSSNRDHRRNICARAPMRPADL
jgi:outer membrane protein TolC